MRRWLACVLLAGCGAPAARHAISPSRSSGMKPAPAAHEEPPAERRDRPVVCELPPHIDIPEGDTVWGIICDLAGKPLMGATVAVDDEAMITDAQGLFHGHPGEGEHEVGVYYCDATLISRLRASTRHAPPFTMRIDTAHVCR